MGNKEVKTVNLIKYSDTVVCIDGEYYNYSAGEAVNRVKYKTLDDKPELLQILRNKKFTLINKTYDKNIEATSENIEEERKDESIDFVAFIRQIVSSEVTEFFSYQVTIQICGKHITTFYPLMDYVTTVDENIVTFLTYEGNSKAIFGKFGSEADALFGPQYPTKSAIFINDFRTTYEYRRPITDIEKIFLTKRYRDLEVIGTEKDYRYNGKVEVLELDLHNPDMAVYAQMRAIDNCIEVEWRDE